MSRSPDGFTLIETLVAAGLLVAVCLGTAQLLAFAVAQQDVARQQLVMGVLAEAKVDELSRSFVSALPAPTADDALERSVDGCVDTVIESGRSYLRRWRIVGVPGFGSDAYTISVRVVPISGARIELRVTTIRIAGGL